MEKQAAMTYKEYYQADLNRYGGKWTSAFSWQRRFHYYFRKAQTAKNRLTRAYYKYRLKRLKDKRGVEIYSATQIGKGFYIGHPYNITMSAYAVIGENCNISKGVMIGPQFRGKRKGVPVIGNQVWIGNSAMIIGQVHIGDDVLIAPGAYVNCDVPSHSVVIGNPCTIHHRDHATEGYVENLS